MLRFKSFEELLENEGLKKKAAKSGISYGTLKKVYNRGMAAWRTGHRPGTTPQQWGMARVNSYIGKGKGTYYGADADLSGKGKKKSKKESVGEATINEKLDHAALKRDFNEHEKGSGKVHTITKTHTIKNAHIMGKHSFDTKKGKVPVLKRYDRKQFTRGPVTIKKGTHVVIDKDESYAHGYHPDAGHFRFIHHSDPDIKNIMISIISRAFIKLKKLQLKKYQKVLQKDMLVKLQEMYISKVDLKLLKMQ